MTAPPDLDPARRQVDPSSSSSDSEDESETSSSSSPSPSSSDEESSDRDCPPPPTQPPPLPPLPSASTPPSAYDLAAAPRDLLIAIVKAAQREGLGDAWKAHAKTARLPHADPARARPAALVAFASGLVAGGGAGARLVARHAAVHEQVTAEAAAAAAGAAAVRVRRHHVVAAPLPPVGLTATAVHALVHRTAAHARFVDSYTFPSTARGWVRAPRPAPLPPLARPPPAATPPPPLLALDCEMVATEGDASALVRLALVRARPTGVVEGGGEGEAPAASTSTATTPGAPGPAAAATLARLGYGAVDVLLATLVRPDGPVVDWRTAITGLGPGSLDGAPLSRRAAARAVAAAIADAHSASVASATAAGADLSTLLPPILVGHALHHDLKALKLDAGPVIDTALVFSYAGLPRCAPGLADLHDALCPGPPLRVAAPAEGGPANAPTPPHCCVADAAAALALAAVAAGHPHAGAPAPVPPPARKVPREALCRLLVHGLPRAAVLAEIKKEDDGGDEPDEAALSAAAARLATSFLTAAGAPPPPSVEPAGPAKAWAVYADPAAADAAFGSLPSERRETDALGRAQKVVAAAGLTARVRRSAAHAGLTHGVDRGPKRDRAPASVAHGKRLRAAAGG